MAKNVCEKCHNVIPAGITFCPFCGSEQEYEELLNNQRPKKRRQHNVPVIEVGAEIAPVEVKKVENLREDKEPEKTVVQMTEKESVIKDTSENNVNLDDADNIEEDDVVEEVLVGKEDIEDIEGEDEEKEISHNTEEEDESNASESDRNEDDVGATDTKEEIEDFADDKTPKKASKVKGKTSTRRFSKKKEKSKKELEYELYHDSLTGLFNEKAYKEKIENLSVVELCIISIDANNLKMINDTKGHKYGDKLLTIIADCMKKSFGNNCYRLHGDEFIVILVGIKKDVIESKIEVFNKLLQQEENNQTEPMIIQAAVGFSYSDGKSSVPEIVELADKEMYKNKRAIKEIYNPNYDGYYDDVKAEYEGYKKELDKDNLKKVVMTIVIAIIAIILSIVFM